MDGPSPPPANSTLTQTSPHELAVTVAAGAPLSDPSILLARQVKSYGSVTYRPLSTGTKILQTSQVVVAYDSQLVRRKCNPSSPDYDESINLNTYADELFDQNEIWSRRDGLLDVALNDLAEIHGFAIKKEKKLLVCNRYNPPGKTPTTRNFITGALAAGCEFHLKLKPLSRIARLNKAGTKWLYKLVWDGPVEIIGKCLIHTGSCSPCAYNRIVTLKRAGKCPRSMGPKQLSGILQAVITAYPQMTEEQKSEVSALANQMKKILPADDK